MEVVTALSEHPLATQAVGEVVGTVLDAAGPAPDLLVLFAGSAHAGAVEDIAGALQALLRPVTFIGSTAFGVLAGEHQTADGAGIALFAAYGIDADAAVLDELAPTTLVLDERSPFVLDGAVHIGAGVAADVHGCRVEVEAVPDCRPVGEPYTVTAVEGTLVHELGGRPALARVESIIDELDGEERRLAKGGLHLGLVIDESKARFRPRDFAVLDLLGGDRDRRAIALGGEVPLGATVQLLVRDDEVEDRHLSELLARASGALLFTNGGEARVRELPPIPIAGMVRAVRSTPMVVRFSA